MSRATDNLDRREITVQMVAMKDRLMRLGLYRTARLMDIPTQEIGWELQGEPTPQWQKGRQQETLTP